MTEENQPTEEQDKVKLFGDLVADVAQPIAAAIDAVFKTDIKNCGGCARRREALNNMDPRSLTDHP